MKQSEGFFIFEKNTLDYQIIPDAKAYDRNILLR